MLSGAPRGELDWHSGVTSANYAVVPVTVPQLLQTWEVCRTEKHGLFRDAVECTERKTIDFVENRLFYLLYEGGLRRKSSRKIAMIVVTGTARSRPSIG